MKKFLLLTGLLFSLRGFSQYTVTPITYAPDSFDVGTQITLNDDQFSPMIQMPFSFCFYGRVYNRLTVGSNSVISFDSTYANGYCPWPIGAAIPGSTDPLNSIFLAWQDLYMNSANRFYYNVYGSAPNRRFVVSCYRSPMYSTSCQAKIFTGEVMLFESTNNIEMHIQRKELCTGWNGGNAIEGMQNATGTQAAVVSGRNYPTQWITNNDAWRFVYAGCPSGIENNITDNFLKIYPNPASGELHINYSGKTEKFAVEMSDPEGRLIFKDNSSAEHERTLLLAGISPGIYFIRLVSEDGNTMEIRKQEIQ